MRVFRHYDGVPEEAKGAVTAIGNFDGIHRGHQAVISKAGRLARELGLPHAVLSFEPHPRAYFNPTTPPFRLTPFRLKARLIEALGADYLFVLRFNRALAELSAEDFVTRVLGEGLGLRHVVVGDNFRFGRQRQGDISFLQQTCRALEFSVACLERVEGPGAKPYSSTSVREYLKAGNPTRAALMLGRYWEIEGRVQHGDKRGREFGFPTANIPLGPIITPAFGIYAVRAGIDRGTDTVWHAGVANLGIRPMYKLPHPLLEVHLFDFDQDIYGRHVRVAFVDYLRPEMSFESTAELKTQMIEDSRRARIILAAEEWDASWPASPFMPGTAEPPTGMRGGPVG